MSVILIFSPYAINTPHFETELELAQIHLDAGDTVLLLGCEAGLKGCDVNSSCTSAVCDRCIGRLSHGLSLLQNTDRFTRLPTISSTHELPDVQTSFESIDELKAYRFQDFDIGFGVLSSLVSLSRTPTPDLEVHAKWLANAMRSTALAYVHVHESIAEHEITQLYVHNGRYGILRAAVRAAQSSGIDYATVEVGCNNHHYHLFHNALPHDTDYRRAEMQELWSAADLATREKTATSFYEDRAAKKPHWWKNFGSEMTTGRLPTNWNSTIPLPVFVSSEDEMVSISDRHKNELYPDGGQIEAITRILNDLQLLKDNPFTVYLRIHPNLVGINDAFTTALRTFGKDYDYVEVIEPDSEIDSYEMLKVADRIISFGSSVGVEAVYWNTASIVGTTSFFFPKEVGYQPQSHTELMELVLRDELPPTNIEPALIYGFYFMTHGTKFRYYESDSIFRGKYRGVEITGPPPTAAPSSENGSSTLLSRFRRKLSSVFSRASTNNG